MRHRNVELAAPRRATTRAARTADLGATLARRRRRRTGVLQRRWCPTPRTHRRGAHHQRYCPNLLVFSEFCSLGCSCHSEFRMTYRDVFHRT